MVETDNELRHFHTHSAQPIYRGKPEGALLGRPQVRRPVRPAVVASELHVRSSRAQEPSEVSVWHGAARQRPDTRAGTGGGGVAVESAGRDAGRWRVVRLLSLRRWQRKRLASIVPRNDRLHHPVSL